MIPMTPIKSSNIKAVGYDPATLTMQVEFHGSEEPYLIENVPAALHGQMLKAPSPGGFYHSFIKNRFPTKKMPKR